MKKTPIAASALALALAAGGAIVAVAGPLNPPPGPVTPSYKTLADVEPRTAINAANTPGDGDSLFRITQPGSYYLTGDVAGQPGKKGIEVAASHVTIDLNGFHLAGGPGSLSGIDTTGAFFGVSAQNGSVHNWGGLGIDFSTATSCRISDVTLSFNTGMGVYTGHSSVVVGCAAAQNGSDGIYSGPESVIRSCTATENGGDGIVVYSGSVAESCTADENTGAGFAVTNNSTARGCAASNNVGSGFAAADNSQVLDCIANYNGAGGIDAGFGVQVVRCSADSNTGHGIECGSYCTITDNACRNNKTPTGSAGVYLSAIATHTCVEGNNCVGNNWGINCDGQTNLVVRNTCAANQVNISIIAGNRVGLVVNLPLSGNVNNNGGGNSTGADPISNFVY